MKTQLVDQEIFISKVADSAINTPQVVTANFVGGLLNSAMPPIPDVTRSADNMVGDGNERAQKLRRGWLIPVQIPVGGLLNTETAARFGNRVLGGTRTASSEVAPPGSTAFDVTTNMQTKAQGRIPFLFTFGYDLGGYKFYFPSCAVGNFEIQFEGEQDVTWQANIINTGMHRINSLEATLVSAGHDAAYAAVVKTVTPIVPPAPPAHHLMHPAATKVTFSNGTTIDFAAAGELISGACGLDNQIIVRQLPGDTFLVPTNRKMGAYSRDLHRGVRVPSARLKVTMDDELSAFVMAQSGTEITSLIYLFRGEDNIGASTHFYEFEWKCPSAEIESLASDPDGEDAAVTMMFYPKTDAVTDGYWIQRVRTTDILLQ